MREATLRQVLVVRACEETDVHGAELALAFRETAGREAFEAFPNDPAAQLAQRAERLAGGLEDAHPALAALASASWFVPRPWFVAVIAFAAALLTDSLGRDRSLSLLAFPLFGLLLWNAGVGGVWCVARLRGAAATDLPAWGRGWSWLRRRTLGDGFAARAGSGFAAHWLAVAAPLEAARWRAALHVGALAFALGIVASLYTAGFAFAYEATWESTFLSAASVQRLLAIILGPAAWLLGNPVPDVAGIAALRAPATGPAAEWIHRFALTVVAGVGIPRLLLALRAFVQVGGYRAALGANLSEPYFAKILSLGRGEGQRIAIVPYSTQLSPAAAVRVLELAHHLFGNRALVATDPGVTYGAECPAGGNGSALLVFGLAQSPEREVHGRFAAEFSRVYSVAGGRSIVILDAERYAAVADEERLAERGRAWRRVLDEVGVPAIDLTPDSSADELLEAAQAALAEHEPGT